MRALDRWETKVTEQQSDKYCLACKRDANATPLVQLAYREATIWICPELDR